MKRSKRSTPPSKRRSITYKRRPVGRPAKRRLLVHARHTGHLLPHSATSYPLLTFLVLMVGVLMVICSNIASASDYTVHALVPGIIPSSPAAITSPVDQNRFSSTPVTVSGTCPPNAAYIKLYRNDFFSGVALCQSSLFTLQTDLFPGVNVLKARVFNIADQEGPVSTTITVFYDVPVITPPATSSPGSTSPTTSRSSSTHTGSGSNQANSSIPISISADYAYRGYYVGQEIAWQLGITGGNSPYSIHIDWGDGKDTVQRLQNSGPLTIAHTYSTPVKDSVAYVIKITASDANGNSTFVQLAVLITVPGVRATANIIGSAGSGVIPPTHQPSGFIAKLLPYAWPAYGTSIVMLSSFWLGEHREFNLLRNHIRTPRRLRHT